MNSDWHNTTSKPMFVTIYNLFYLLIIMNEYYAQIQTIDIPSLLKHILHLGRKLKAIL